MNYSFSDTIAKFHKFIYEFVCKILDFNTQISDRKSHNKALKKFTKIPVGPVTTWLPVQVVLQILLYDSWNRLQHTLLDGCVVQISVNMAAGCSKTYPFPFHHSSIAF